MDAQKDYEEADEFALSAEFLRQLNALVNDKIDVSACHHFALAA